MVKEEKKIDLKDQLIDFTVMIAYFAEALTNTKAANHMGGK